MNETVSLPLDIKLRVGHAVLNNPVQLSDLAAAIDKANAQVRLENLPDHLNPGIIDRDKAQAFVDALSRLSEDSLKPLSGQALLLDYDGLMLGASAPTLSATFAQPFKIEVVDVQRSAVLARVSAQPDCDLARSRVAEARARVKSLEEEVKRLESQSSATPDAATLSVLSAARLRRFAAARAWEQNARAWSDCPQADSNSKTDLADATRAVSAYAVPSGRGMP
jgi:hypothetical protein